MGGVRAGDMTQRRSGVLPGVNAIPPYGGTSHDNKVSVYPTPPLHLMPSSNTQPGTTNLSPQWFWPQAPMPYPQPAPGSFPTTGMCWPPPWGGTYNLLPPPFSFLGNFANSSENVNSKSQSVSTGNLQTGSVNTKRGGKSAPSRNARAPAKKPTLKKHGEVNMNKTYSQVTQTTARLGDFEIAIGSQSI